MQVHQSGKNKLVNCQEIFEHSHYAVKLKQLHKVWWLSMGECVEAMYRAWDKVYLSLDDEANDHSGNPSSVAKVYINKPM